MDNRRLAPRAAGLALIAALRYATIVRTLPRGEPLDNPQWQREWRRALKHGCHAHVRVGMRTLTKRMPTKTWAGRPNASSTPRVPCFRPRKHAAPHIDFRLTTNLGPLVAFIPWHYLLLAPRPLWLALTAPERTAILRHELAHIRRRDLWKSLAVRVLALPQWFNPLVWLAVRRFDEAAEWHCDKLAACGLARNQTTLANSLLRTAELAALKRPPRTLGFLAAVPKARRSSCLKRRIERLITPRFKEESIMKRLAILALLALAAAAQLIRIEHVAAETPPPFSRDATSSERSAPHAAPPTSTALQAHDVITVHVDYGTRKRSEDGAYEHRERVKFQIACEITKILPNGNYSIEGHQTIRKDGNEQRISLTGEVHPQAIQPDRTVNSRSIVNLNIDKMVQPAAEPAGYYKNPAPPTLPGRAAIQAAPVAAVPPPSAETQASLDEAEAARKAGDRNREFAAITKLPYVIEPPDVLEITFVGTRRTNRYAGSEQGKFRMVEHFEQFDGNPRKFVVAADGTIPWGKGGHVLVAGRTAEQLEAELLSHLSGYANAHVDVRVTSYNSKVAYVITKNPGAGDEVIRVPIEYPLSADNNIGKLLKTVYGLKGIPTGAKVTLCGAGVKEAEAREIIWDAAANAPTPETNYPILPGDRIFVVAPAPPLAPPMPAAARSPVPAAILTDPAAHAPPQLPAPQPAPGTVIRRGEHKQVLFKIAVIHDRSGDMAELGRDLREAGAMLGDSATMSGALRILDKHGLTKTIADPAIVTVVGRPASMELTPGASDAPTFIELTPKSVRNGLEGQTVWVDMSFKKGEGPGRGVLIRFGETYVVASRSPHPPHDNLGPNRTYVVITPELVD